MATLSTKEYADLRGISQRAVQKSIAKHKDSKDLDTDALIGVDKIEKVGSVSQLVMKKQYKRTIDAHNRKLAASE